MQLIAISATFSQAEGMRDNSLKNERNPSTAFFIWLFRNTTIFNTTRTY